MLFEWQGILQFISQGGSSFDSVFFSFTAHCCFMATLKTSAHANAGQSHRLTYCIKNLHCCNLKSLIFKHSLLFIHTFKNTTTFEDLFFVSQSLTNIISLPLIYSISSKHISDFSARKRKPVTSGSIFPTSPRQRSNPTPGKALQMKFPTPWAQKMVKCPGFARGWGS